MPRPIFRQIRERQELRNPRNTMKITIILCTYNRCGSLPTALDSLAAQELPGSVEWEILVVDNNSNDQTEQVVRDFSRRYPGRFRYLFETNQGLSRARNAGVREARGDILAFTDDDVTAEPRWLENLTSGLASEGWAGAGGRVLRELTCPLPRWLSFEGRYERMAAPLVLFDLGSKRCDIDDFAIGANMAYRKEIFVKYGGFRTDLGRSGDSLLGLEDNDFAHRVLAAGERLLYEPSAVVYHPVPQNRLSKEYFLGWWFGLGRASIRHLSPGPAVWGIPRCYLRMARNMIRLVPRALEWAFTLKACGRFYYKTQVWQIAGSLVECYHQWRNVRPAGLTLVSLGTEATSKIPAPGVGQ
jgi:glycosyltransferase involved in cell wall biosynthesis